jgi:predicted phosphodiesterase
MRSAKMKLYALSDLHLSHSINRQALETLPAYPEDWLILAGDVGETFEHLHFAFSRVTRRFAQVLWVPGNHELWTLSSHSSQMLENSLRGEERYRQLIALCHNYGVLTPEDPYVVWPGEGGPALLAPLFLLYDYSFRPATIAKENALDWALETDVVCTDEFLLHPDPYPSRSAWCEARCDYTEKRLEAATSNDLPTILINHFPLQEQCIRLANIPRFSLWCGTTRSQNWHIRFSATIVVYGHLHMRATDYWDGTRFEEVSLGYPQYWKQEQGIQSYLREILPGPPEVSSLKL